VGIAGVPSLNQGSSKQSLLVGMVSNETAAALARLASKLSLLVGIVRVISGLI